MSRDAGAGVSRARVWARRQAWVRVWVQARARMWAQMWHRRVCGCRCGADVAVGADVGQIWRRCGADVRQMRLWAQTWLQTPVQLWVLRRGRAGGRRSAAQCPGPRLATGCCLATFLPPARSSSSPPTRAGRSWRTAGPWLRCWRTRMPSPRPRPWRRRCRRCTAARTWTSRPRGARRSRVGDGGAGLGSARCRRGGGLVWVSTMVTSSLQTR